MVENISLYKSFLYAAEYGSISGAARKLYVSQPAVSNEIMQLEKQLGVKLFFRTSKGITLTPEGEILFGYVKKAFSFLDAGENKINDLSGGTGGILRVGASDMTLRFFLLDYLDIFRKLYPKIRISVTNAPTPETLRLLRNGAIDFCVVSEPVREEEDICFIPLREIRDVFICSGKNELSKRKILTFADLEKQTLIMLEKGTSTRYYVDEWMKKCSKDGKVPEPEIELATSDLLIEFAKRNIGVACVVEDFAKDEIEKGELCSLEFEQPFPKRKFMLAYLKKVPLSPASAKIINTIINDLDKEVSK